MNGGSIYCAGGTVSEVDLLSGEMTMTNVQNEDYTEGYGIRVAGGKLIAAKAKMYNTVFESGSVTLYGNARFFDTVINGMAIGMWNVGQQFVNTTVNSGSFTVGLGTADGLREPPRSFTADPLQISLTAVTRLSLRELL